MENLLLNSVKKQQLEMHHDFMYSKKEKKTLC